MAVITEVQVQITRDPLIELFRPNKSSLGL